MKTITATLAALLLAGASTAALAQDREHERGQAAAPQPHPMAPQGGHARPGAPPGPQGAPAASPQGGQGRGFERHDGGQGQRFQGPAAPAPGAPAPQRFDHGQGPGPAAGRQFDHERGPREVIPPNGDRGQPDRRGNPATAGRFDGRDVRNDGGHRDGGANPWRGGERWQAGRAPPVFWSHDRFRIGAYRQPYGYYVRSWGFGDFLPRGWYGQDYWVGDFINYGLPYPPPGYEWVRVGGDALMIDRFNGRIVQVVRGIFW